MKRFVKVAALCLALTCLVALFCAPVQAADATSTKNIVGNGTVGEGVGKHTTVVDFAETGLDGFAALNNESVTMGHSQSWGKSVLKINLASAGIKTGVQKTFGDAAFLANASTLSLHIVAQASNYTVTLHLSGIDKNGAPIVLEAQATATTNEWQTVTFDVSAFAALVDTNAPVTVKLTTATEDTVGSGATWMIKSIYVGTLQSFPELVLPIAAAACGLVLGFFLFFIIYRATCKRNRRPHWEEVR